MHLCWAGLFKTTIKLTDWQKKNYQNSPPYLIYLQCTACSLILAFVRGHHKVSKKNWLHTTKQTLQNHYTLMKSCYQTAQMGNFWTALETLNEKKEMKLKCYIHGEAKIFALIFFFHCLLSFNALHWNLWWPYSFLKQLWKAYYSHLFLRNK